MESKATTVIADFLLFNQQNRIEAQCILPHDPDLREVIKIVMDKLHETKDTNGKIVALEEDEKTEHEKVFTSLQFLEISLDRKEGRMILYKWTKGSRRDKDGFLIPFSESGEYKITKQKI